MSKICLITDIHFGHSNNSDTILENTLRFFKEKFIPNLEKENIKEIYILGDLFESRTTINTKVHSEVYDLFDNHLSKFKIFILIGNHDIHYNSTTEVHSLKFLHKFENVTVVDKPIIYKNKLMVPWLIDQNDINNIINNLDLSGINILMGHFDMVGFNFSKFVISNEGISPESIANNFDFVFSGHYHTRSVKNINGTKFVYVGSPCQFTRVDADEERGYLLLDEDKNEYEFVSNTISSKFVEISYPTQPSEELIKNNNVDVIFEYDNETFFPKKFDEYLDKISNLKPSRIKPVYINNTEITEHVEIKKANLTHIPNLIKNYVDGLEYKYKNKLQKRLDELHIRAKGEN